MVIIEAIQTKADEAADDLGMSGHLHMRLKNYTDFSDEKVSEIMQFVRPCEISNFDVRISNSKEIFAGTAYPNDCPSYHKTTDPFIVDLQTALNWGAKERID